MLFKPYRIIQDHDHLNERIKKLTEKSTILKIFINSFLKEPKSLKERKSKEQLVYADISSFLIYKVYLI